MAGLIMLGSFIGYLFLCLLVAKYKFEDQDYHTPTVARLFYEEAMSGFIVYPFNICYWLFKKVVRVGIKINKNIDKWLDKVV